MTKVTFSRPRLSAPRFLLALGLALAPISAFAQNYVFDSASVNAKATATADGVFAATNYFVAEQCAPGCNGAKLSAAGFKDTGFVVKNAPNGDAGSSATVTNNTTATTDPAKGVTLNISSLVHAQALAIANPGWAATPLPYKGPDQPWFDGTHMWMAWKVNKNSTLTVTNLTGIETPVLDGGQYFATGEWTITVTTQCCGIVIATYDEETDGNTFNAAIPANTIVTVSWSSTAGAKTAYDAVKNKATSAKVDVSVTGSVTIK